MIVNSAICGIKSHWGKAGFREVCSIFCNSPKAWQKNEFYNFPSVLSTKKCFNNDVEDAVIPSKGDLPP
jgi:hypothetical protein